MNATSKTLIILHFRYPQGKLVFSTLQKVLSKYWNSKKKRIKVTDAVPESSYINKILNKIDSEINRIYNDLIYPYHSNSEHKIIEGNISLYL